VWHRIEFILFRFFLWFAEILPLSVVCWIARRMGDLVFVLWRKRRGIALANVTRAFGSNLSANEKKELGRKSFEHVASAIAELFLIPTMIRDVKKRFRVDGLEHLDPALSRGRGVVLVISHLGSWESLLHLRFFIRTKSSVVVKKLRNPYIQKILEERRRMTGVNPVEKENSMKTVLSALKKNEVVAILIDQWDGPDGLWINFFGEATSTTSVPARLAKKTGCALIPAFCLRKGTGLFEIHLKPEVPIHGDGESWERATTERLNQILEGEILQSPEQWMWGHRRWKPKPSLHRMA
jgi:Kdo2-lipid IVA lauroyltransferase/acyltransferase